MKWIGLVLVVFGTLLMLDHRNGFVPTVLGLMIIAYWYFVEREPEPPTLDATDCFAEGFELAPLVESSTSFDLPDLRPFLQGLLSHLSGGFSQRTLDHIVDLAARMKHDEERSLDYQVTFRGEQAALKIALFKNDVEEITVYFFSPKRLAEWIDSEMESFLSARGM